MRIDKLIYLLAFCLLSSGFLFGQDFSPFPFQSTYVFAYENQVNDTFLYSLSVDSSGVEGTDSVWFFNEIARLETSADLLGNCSGAQIHAPFIDLESEWRRRSKNNIFGYKMRAKDYGRFVFYIDAMQDSFSIETQLQAGSSWVFNLARGLTATYDSSYAALVHGVMDTLQHISLCNGSTILLSKAHGFIQAPAFMPSPHAGANLPDYPQQLMVWGISDPGFGNPILDWSDIYDFEVGDLFQSAYRVDAGYWDHNHYYAEDIILSKTLWPDSVYYEVYRRSFRA